jgi:hypothetical protein
MVRRRKFCFASALLRGYITGGIERTQRRKGIRKDRAGIRNFFMFPYVILDKKDVFFNH